METNLPTESYAVCVRNDECADLELRKIYRILPDPEAQKENYLRVIDESEEDYLYPEAYFVRLELPHAAALAFRTAS